jgi:2-C-methyl-D-erythritol 2,4-cyclodiphosphate synthase
MGYDMHRLVKGRPLVLGGVRIPFDLGLAGHSDADVLLHAVCDALLGAAALGDIGRHFSDSDPDWAGISSLVLLEKTAAMVRDAGFEVVNIDVTLIAQAPKIGPYRNEMRRRIARAVGVEEGCVNVKATTTEGLDATGQGMGIAASAAALLQPLAP